MPILFVSTVMLAGAAWCSHLCYIGSWDNALAGHGRTKENPRTWKLMRWGLAVQLDRADQSFPGAVPTQLRWVRSLQLCLPLQRTDKKRHKETTSRGILHSVRRLLSGLFQECSGLFFFKAETRNRAQYICGDCGIPARLFSGYCAYLKLLIFGIESNPVKGIDHTGGYIAKM